jgi:uncharacterized protein YqjF (DUF2071 family)
MNAKDILKQTKHRAFMYPSRSWKFYQEWNNTIFLHWEVAPSLIQPYLPESLKLDTINGKTWISLVAFDMNHVGLRSMPKLPYVSNFHEINIRAYTICEGKPSVYFLNMEGSKRSSCVVLKVLSKLPYRYSKMKRTSFSYESENRTSNDFFYIEYGLENQPILKDETDLWLTERYTLLQDYKHHIIEYDVHHLEWPMQRIRIKNLELDYPRFNPLIQNEPDRVHYSTGVQVLTWDKKRLNYD